MLAGTKDNMRILHPLPRVNEISEDVDDNKKAYYFQQALNGVYTRQAIIFKKLDFKWLLKNNEIWQQRKNYRLVPWRTERY